MRILSFLLFLFFFIPDGSAQTDSNGTTGADSSVPVVVRPNAGQKKDTIRSSGSLPRVFNDSVSKRPRSDTGWRLQGNWNHLPAITGEIFSHHPWMGFTATPETNFSARRTIHGREIHFYVIIALLLLFAILRNAFSKYFNDLFRVFFRTTLKQRQIREQLMQTPLPSLLLNAFFVLSGGLYLAFVLDHYGKNPADSVWELAVYCSAGIAAAYFVKFVGLRILGSIFGIGQAVTSYIFVVFIINKMVGILLLPFILFLAFTTGSLYEGALLLSYIMLGGMLIYRFILTFAAIRNQIKVNPFHFLLYIAAFEVAPLILVYRALLLYFPEMA
jgi:hypothetical protein